MTPIVLAYAGARDESVAMAWLAEQHGAEVVTLTLDLGQGRSFEDVRERALALGAVRAHVIDARDAFVREYLWPALSACAMRAVPALGQALASAVLARHLVELAELEDVDTVAHAESGVQAMRLEQAIHALNPGLRILAPALEWTFSELERQTYAAAIGMPAAWMADDTVAESNLWEMAVAEARKPGFLGQTEETRFPGADEARFPASALLDIAFAHGVPVGINGVALEPVDLIVTIQTIARAHGVGRIVSAADRSGAALDAPAALVLTQAHAALQRDVLPSDLDALACDLGATYASLAEAGGWYGGTRQALNAFVTHVQSSVTGDVTITLSGGRPEVTAVRAVPAAYGATRTAPASAGKDS